LTHYTKSTREASGAYALLKIQALNACKHCIPEIVEDSSDRLLRLVDDGETHRHTDTDTDTDTHTHTRRGRLNRGGGRASFFI
jgi:hypothetical protein